MKLFISYRRDDEPYLVGRLRERLAAKTRAESIFLDVDSIGPGENFRQIIKEQIISADIALVVIGPRWDAYRLADAGDFVRIEIENAMSLDKLIVPILSGSTDMPSEDILPTTLTSLAARQAYRVRPDPDFLPDSDRLAEDLPGALERFRRQAPTRNNLEAEVGQFTRDTADWQGDWGSRAALIAHSALLRETLRESSISTAQTLFRLGQALLSIEAWEEAAACLDDCVRGRDGPSAPIRAVEMAAVVDLHLAREQARKEGNLARAVELVENAVRRVELALGIDISGERLGLLAACYKRLATVTRGAKRTQAIQRAIEVYSQAVRIAPGRAFENAIAILANFLPEDARAAFSDLPERSNWVHQSEDFWIIVDQADGILADALSTTGRGADSDAVWATIFAEYGRAFSMRSTFGARHAVLAQLDDLVTLSPWPKVTERLQRLRERLSTLARSE